MKKQHLTKEVKEVRKLLHRYRVEINDRLPPEENKRLYHEYSLLHSCTKSSHAQRDLNYLSEKLEDLL